MKRRVVDGKYELLRLLGQGGMGAVYEALDLGSSRHVALKLLLLSDSLAKEPDVIARFKREAHASAAIDSPHVVQVIDSGVDPSTNDAFMVMELLAGEDVHQLLRRLGPLRSPVAAVWSAISDAREFGIWFGVELEGPFVEGASTRGKTRPTTVDPEIAKLQEGNAGIPFEVTVERLDAPRHLSFRWHPFAVDPNIDYSSEPKTLVEFELGEIEGGTRITITESGFENLPPARRVAAFTSNEGGWQAQTKLLAKYVSRAVT